MTKRRFDHGWWTEDPNRLHGKPRDRRLGRRRPDCRNEHHAAIREVDGIVIVVGGGRRTRQAIRGVAVVGGDVVLDVGLAMPTAMPMLVVV